MGTLLHATTGLSRIPATEKSNKLVEIYSDIVPSIASSVARRLPPSFDRDDLEQIGRLALLEAAPAVESYLRTRVHGAIVDTARGARYRDATHLDLTAAIATSDDARSPLTALIEEEERLTVLDSVQRLPADQARVITANFGDGRRRGRPRKADVATERAAIAGLRNVLAKAA